MLHRFKDFTSETFHPRNISDRDPKMDDIIKQKESGGEVYVDFRERPANLLKISDNGKLPIMGSISKRNPFSSSIQFKKNDVIVCEFAFYLHPIYADARKKNLYAPYELDDMELLGLSKKYQIIYDNNIDKLVENMCKLIYNSQEDSGVQKAKDLKKEVIKMAFAKNIFIEK